MIVFENGSNVYFIVPYRGDLYTDSDVFCSLFSINMVAIYNMLDIHYFQDVTAADNSSPP